MLPDVNPAALPDVDPAVLPDVAPVVAETGLPTLEPTGKGVLIPSKTGSLGTYIAGRVMSVSFNPLSANALVQASAGESPAAINESASLVTLSVGEPPP